MSPVQLVRAVERTGVFRPPALLLEVAHLVGRCLRRRIAVLNAARLLLEVRQRRLVGLRGGIEPTKHGATALVACQRRRYRRVEGLFVATGQAHQRRDALRVLATRAFLPCHSSLAVREWTPTLQDPCAPSPRASCRLQSDA